MDQYFFPTSYYRFWKGRHKTSLIIRPGDHLCRKSNRIYKNSLALTRILARLQDTRSIHKSQQCETNFYDPIMTDTHPNIFVKTQRMYSGASLVVQLIKNPSAMQETGVPSLGWEDPREKEMTTHSSILAWEIPWTEKPVRLQSAGRQESDPTQ